jgi:hypothetical protein
MLPVPILAVPELILAVELTEMLVNIPFAPLMLLFAVTLLAVKLPVT